MQKVLLSWITPWTDFDRQQPNTINREGTNYLFHKKFYTYDKHILLSSDAKDSTRAEVFVNALKNDFAGRDVELRCLDVKDVMSLQEIRAKVEPILQEYSEDELFIFTSPGTVAMSIVWVLFHQSAQFNTRLLQTRKPDAHRRTQKETELLEIHIERDTIPSGLIIQHQRINKVKKEKAYCFTKSMEAVYKKAERVAQTDDIGALILGESGTGKEHLARTIHETSARKNAPFIAINCSAFANNLLESRLFGHQKGAFTGADQDHIGLFEQANGGTIFLDEIGDISAYMQQALLRALEQKEIHPIGGKPRKIDVRVVAATNKNLSRACEQKKFRWDLYYRLAVIELELPSLAERGLKEKKQLLQFFLEQKAKAFNKPKLSIAKPAQKQLDAYPFPGNIRELEHLISSFYVLCDSEVTLSNLPKKIREIQPHYSPRLEDATRLHVLKIWRQNQENNTVTAKMLGISYNTLMAKLRAYKVINN